MELVPVIQIKRHIFCRIPKLQLAVPTKTAKLLTPEEVGIKIIGYEIDTEIQQQQPIRKREYHGIILFTYKAFENKKERLFIGSYNIASKNIQHYLTLPPKTCIIGATLSNLFISKSKKNKLSIFIF